jgi:hypothetical protein
MADGGLRDRLIHESVFKAIETELTTLGWFDAGRQHQPITIIDEFPDENADVAFNTLAISMGDSGGTPHEMGSNRVDEEIIFFVDFFAESDALGRHVRGDIYNFLKRLDEIPILDYSQALDPEIFRVEVQEEVDKRKPERAVQKWQKHWYVISFSVIDYGRVPA